MEFSCLVHMCSLLLIVPNVWNSWGSDGCLNLKGIVDGLLDSASHIVLVDGGTDQVSTKAVGLLHVFFELIEKAMVLFNLFIDGFLEVLEIRVDLLDDWLSLIINFFGVIEESVKFTKDSICV